MTGARPVVHLELHTADRAAAGAFYARLLRWRPELIETRSGNGWPSASAEAWPVASSNVEPEGCSPPTPATSSARQSSSPSSPRSTPARTPAGRADSPRRPRLLSPGDRRHAADDAGLLDSALQRAYKTVDERFPSRSQQQTLRLLGDNEFSRLVERFVAAWEQNDVDAIVSMLADDARMTMPPLPSWYRGRPQVAPFLHGFTLARYQALAADSHLGNGQPALAGYLWDVHHGRRPDRRDHGLLVTPDTFQRFGLPESFAG
jgi:hypothetical protein